MFATLIVQLPSNHKGGGLIVKHCGTQKIHDFGEAAGECSKHVYYAAHFSDVWHEVRKVTSGYRCALVYNLCKSSIFNEPPCSPSKLSSQITNLLLNEWENEPKALVFPLNHMYSYKGFARDLIGLYSRVENEQWRSSTRIGRERNCISGLSSLKGFDALLAAAIKLASKAFEGGDGLSLYIGNAEHSTGVKNIYLPHELLIHKYNQERPSMPYHSRNPTACKPKYLRERSLEYNDDFSDIPMFDAITFDGTVVKYTECFSLNYEDCLVAHNFDSKLFWGQGKTEPVGYLGNTGPGIREVFHRTVIIAIRKSTEKELVRQNGSLQHVADYILTKRNLPAFEQNFIDEMRWLIENWNDKVSLVRAPDLTFDEFADTVEAKIIWDYIDKIFKTICDLVVIYCKPGPLRQCFGDLETEQNVIGIFEGLVDKMATSPVSCKLQFSKGDFYLCAMELPLEIAKRALLKIIGVDTMECECFLFQQSDIYVWFICLEAMGMWHIRKGDFLSFCHDIAQVMQADIASIESSDTIIEIIARFKRSLPTIMLALPYRFVALKSASKKNFGAWVHLIKELSALKIANTTALVEAALPGMRKNDGTRPEDVVEFIKLLQETKSKVDIGEFINDVVKAKSLKYDCIKLIKLLSERGLGDINLLYDVAIPGLIDYSTDCPVRYVKETFQVLKEIKSISDVQQIAIDFVKKMAIHKPSKWHRWGFIDLVTMLATEGVAETHTLVQSALSDLRENIESMEDSDVIEVIGILVKGKLNVEVKEFAAAIAEQMSGERLGYVVSECKNDLGDAFLKQEEFLPMITARVRWLEEQLSCRQEFSWCMPDAIYHKHPEIEKLLQGPEEILHYEIYDEIKDIRRFVKDFNLNKRSEAFSAEASIGKANGEYMPCAVIKKNRQWYEAKVARMQKYSEELAELKGDANDSN